MFKPLIVKKILAIGLGIIVMGHSIAGFAQRRKDARKYRVPRSKFVIKHTVPHYGKVVVTAPAGYRTIWAGGAKYFYHGGVYYQKRPSGFVVVSPAGHPSPFSHTPKRSQVSAIRSLVPTWTPSAPRAIAFAIS